MSILKFETHTPRTMRAMYEYMTDSSKTDQDGILGIGVNPKFAVQEMEFLSTIYNHEQIAHPYLQIIFAFDVGLFLPIKTYKAICVAIGNALLLDKRQLVGAIHYKNTEKVHCHYMINYIGVDGTLYRQGHCMFFYYERVNCILIQYGLSPISQYEGVKSNCG